MFMQRRRFLQQSLAAGAGTLLSSSALAGSTAGNEKTTAEKPFQLNYAFHDGMFKNSAGPDFVDQIKWAHGMGFRAIEDNGMMGRSEAQQKKIGETLAFAGHDDGRVCNRWGRQLENPLLQPVKRNSRTGL
jgi:hydroxypyruvate isomerase